jgi:hypothetical protein
MNKKNLKAQAWSIDIVIGVVLFLILIVVIYTLIATNPVNDAELRRNADLLHSKLDSTKNTDDSIPKILTDNKLNPEELKNLLDENYNEMKAALGLTQDFCIVITYTSGGIYEIDTDKYSYGNSADNLNLGKDSDGAIIYCGS